MFLRAFINMAAEDLGDPLTNEEKAALDTIEGLSERADLQLVLNLKAPSKNCRQGNFVSFSRPKNAATTRTD